MRTYMKNSNKIAIHNRAYNQGKFSYKLAMNRSGDISYSEFVDNIAAINCTNELK